MTRKDPTGGPLSGGKIPSKQLAPGRPLAISDERGTLANDHQAPGKECAAPLVEEERIVSRRARLLGDKVEAGIQVHGATFEAQRLARLEQDNRRLLEALEQARRERDQALLSLLEAEQELALHRTAMPTDR